MFSTANLLELQQIIDAVHADPHMVLGMHEVNVKEKNALVVRVFIPGAKEVSVLDPQKQSAFWPLEMIHVDGFFEGAIPGRKKWFRYQLQVTNHENHTWTTYDPYSFAPVISDLDRFLFGQGTHYQIFDKLGAHPQTIDGVSGCLFAVWAPNAKRVSVIGDFNGWDGRRHAMRLLQNSGIWELFIPGIVPMDRYQFEIKTFFDVLLKKTDPFGNFQELRPSTVSLVCDTSNYKWNDNAWYEHLQNNPPLENPMNIYEVHMGSWKRKGDSSFLTYNELAETLVPYAKEMGYTHLELLPITEYPYDGSWGYQVTGYYAPTSRYGTPQEFMHFVDVCHQNGLGVLLDWVPAHFPKDAHGLARFDGTALFEHENPLQGEHPEWGTLIYNFGRNEVKNFLLANALFWIERYHIDGLRVDAVASMIYLNYAKESGQWTPNQYGSHENLEAVEFLKHMNSIVLKKHKNALMIAEESTSWQGVSRPVEENGLGFNLKWNMGFMNDFLSYMKKDPLARSHFQNNLTFGMVYAYTENFVLVLSHDEVVHGKKSLLDKMPGDLWKKFANLRVGLGFMYGHPGKKLLFMGGEFGQFIEWDEKRPLDWFLLDYPLHRQMHTYTKELNWLYQNNKAFWYDDFCGNGFEWINCNDNQRSLPFIYAKNR